ncbi:MAG: hypothetical protein R3242_00695 [Akkermansiaceae bacterium]|nr:hypothetical protein [Akkermansiaceae bacterium]
MNFYRQSIILFGAVFPALLAVAVVAGGYLVKSKMEASYEKKAEAFKKQDQARRAADAIEQDIREDKAHLDRWMKKLSGETRATMTSIYSELVEELPEKEFARTAFEPLNNETGLGAASAQPASTIRMQYRGTFRSLQKAMLEYEARMPQLVLQDMSITPLKTSSYQVVMQLSFTAWEK